MARLTVDVLLNTKSCSSNIMTKRHLNNLLSCFGYGLHITVESFIFIGMTFPGLLQTDINFSRALTDSNKTFTCTLHKMFIFQHQKLFNSWLQIYEIQCPTNINDSAVSKSFSYRQLNMFIVNITCFSRSTNSCIAFYYILYRHNLFYDNIISP